MPDEFEDVVLNARRSDVERSHSSGRPFVLGHTRGGRLLACVFGYLDEEQFEIVPITAYDPDQL
jgi:hypothetical protein